MATIAVNVRWATNVDQLKRNIAEGIDIIDAMKTSVNRTAASLSGEGLFTAANRAAAAVGKLGDTSKLTAAEQERLNATMQKAIEKAELMGRVVPQAWRDIADATKSAGGAWSQFVDKFDVGEAIKNPLGAGKQALLAFSEELGPVGVGALATAGAIAAVGVEAFRLADAAAKVGANLGDMADKTGMSVPALSRLQNAAKVAGADLGTLTDATFKFEQKLGEGSSEFGEALAKIGLSVEQLKAAGPDQYLELVAAGLAKIEDPSERAAAGTALLGKQYKDLAAVLADLPKAFELTKDIEPWTKEQADEAEEFEMQLESLKVHAEALGLEIGRTLIPAVLAFAHGTADLVSWLGNFTGVTPAVVTSAHAIAEAWRLAAAAKDLITGDIDTPEVTSGGPQAGHNPAIEVQQRRQQITAAGAPPAPGTKTSLDRAFAEQTTAVRELSAAHKELTADQKRSAAEAEKFAEALAHVTTIGTATADVIDTIDGNVVEGIKYYREQGASVEELARIYGLTKGQVEAVDKQFKFEQTVVTATSKAFQGHYAMMTPLTARYGQLHEALTGVSDTTGDLVATLIDSGTATFTFADNAAFAAQKTEELRQALHDFRAEGSPMGGVLGAITDGIKDLPSLLVKSFTGGGGITGALNAVGAKIGGNLFGESGALSGAVKSATGKLTSLFGKTIGGALGAAIPGIGSLIGPGLQAMWSGLKKLFGGPSAEELKGRQVVADFEKQIQSASSATQKAEAGSESWKLTVITVRDAYLKAGKSAAEAEAAVKRLWESSKKGAQEQAAAIQDINDVLQDQKQDEEDLKAAIQRYGFSIEQLGPQLRKQQLDEQAKQLLNDWRLLVGSGISIVTVNEKMAKSINEYLATAIKTGTEVPAAMKPILESMIKQGTLTDENGNKLNDLNKIKFGETMTEGFDRVVNKLNELLEGLGLIPKALDKIPGRKDIQVVTHYSSDGSSEEKGGGGGSGDGRHGGATGGLVTTYGFVQHFAGGGPVRAINWRPQGEDVVPAMLKPGEWVFNQPAQAQLTALMHAGASMARDLTRSTTTAGGAPMIHLEPRITIQALDGVSVQRVVESGAFTTAMLESFRRDSGGLYTAIANIAKAST